MNPLKKFRDYFIGRALAKSDDVFQQIRAEVLFNFTVFFIITNIPYMFVSASGVHLTLAISVLVALFTVLIILRVRADTRMATYFFLLNFTIQILGHFTINNGLFEAQGTLFAFLFVASGYLLLDRKWGFGIGAAMIVIYILGIYNVINGFPLWKCPPSVADPTEEGNLRYFALIPLSLNMYLVSEFVKARQKAETQLAERKRMIEEKQKEILDSIHYARRIQRTLLPHERHVDKMLRRLRA
jgi:hypothetical protein